MSKFIIDENYKNAKLVQVISSFMNIYGDDESKIMEVAESSNTFIVNLKEDLAQKGSDNITIIDLLDTNTMMEMSNYDEKVMQALNYAMQAYEKAKNIEIFDIKPNDFNDNVSTMLTASRLGKIMDNIIRNFYREFKLAVYPQERNADESFEMLLTLAVEDLANEYLSYDKFCLNNNYTYNPEEPEVKEEHREEYFNWKQDEVDKAIERLYNEPYKPCFVAPPMLKQLKDDLREMIPFEYNEYVDNLRAEDVIGDTENFFNVVKKWNLNPDQINKLNTGIAKLFKYNILEIFDKDDSPEGLKDPNKNRPFFGSITLPEVIYNIILIASTDVLNKKDDENYELLNGTKYVVDAINAELEKNLTDIAEIGEYTGHKILSLFRMLVSTYISQSTLIRYNTSGWMIATQRIANIMMEEDGELVKDKLVDTVPERVEENTENESEVK